ncbi:MAG: DUF429 domain-containing protein [Actinomycetota bacterium]|nr:DUF429 domain-containing protein [Actinomycetota bacterium]
MAGRVLGVDGCPGGWVGALLAVQDDGARLLSWHSGAFAALLDVPADVVAVDVPIGLPGGGERREADLAARRALGAQRSSVFLTPPRAALGGADHASASALSRAAGSTGVSVQTWNILRGVAEVDAALRAPEAAARVVEVHPELSLRRLGGRPLPPKRTPEGRAARLALLADWLPGLAVPRPRPGRAAVDDCLDAVAAAWSGARWLRGQAEVLGGEPDPTTGRPMRIVV